VERGPHFDWRRAAPTMTVSTPSWMHATVSIRRAMVYVIYGCLGFALGGTVAGTLALFRGK